MTPFVKICGITRPGDAADAVACGADAVGFVFWPGSPRAVSPEVAAAIGRAMPSLVWRVGVFVNQTAAEVRDVVGRASLDVVQLHGDEAVDAYVGIGARLIKAIHLDDADRLDEATRYPASVTLLVDATDRERRGGTGRLANWKLAASLAAHRQVLLAGGLTPENAAEAIRQVRPWGIDVSSGVELSPGIKDMVRLRALFEAVADAATEER
jgi:phosphoribosylanthranilate isomerase